MPLVRAEPVMKPVLFVTFVTIHPEMFWLNAVALRNIRLMFVTLEVVHDTILLLNIVAPSNIPDISLTLDISHELIA